MTNIKHTIIYNLYKELYYKEYGVKPAINYGQCNKILDERLKDNKESDLCRIIKMYFENETDRVFNLPSMLSAYYMNKYLPCIKINDNEIPDYAKKWQ